MVKVPRLLMAMPKCWSSLVPALRNRTRTRGPVAVVTVSVHPEAGVADVTVRVAAALRVMTTEPALPAWNVAEAPTAGGVPLVLVEGSQVNLVWTVPVVVAANEGAAVRVMASVAAPAMTARRRRSMKGSFPQHRSLVVGHCGLRQGHCVLPRCFRYAGRLGD